MSIKPSSRLARVKRIFDAYEDRTDYVRLDRNEDPVGWPRSHFESLGRAIPASGEGRCWTCFSPRIRAQFSRRRSQR